MTQAAEGLARLRDAPFGRAARRPSLRSAMPWLLDTALFACAVLAIEGTWPHRLFPPLVLFGALHAIRSQRVALTADRGVLAVILAAAAGFGLVEPAAMLISLALIALNGAFAEKERITQV